MFPGRALARSDQSVWERISEARVLMWGLGFVLPGWAPGDDVGCWPELSVPLIPLLVEAADEGTVYPKTLPLFPGS